MMNWSRAGVMVLGLSLAACGGETGSDQSATAGDDHAMAGHNMSAPMTDASAPAALPDDGIAPVIEIRTAWMRPHPQGRDVTAAYFSAALGAGSADRLAGARIDGAERVEMHGHTLDPATGMMQMHPIPPQDLLADAAMTFAPGGRHLMVFGLAPVVEGDRVEGVLEFERAGDVPVSFEVRSTMPDLPAGQE